MAARARTAALFNNGFVRVERLSGNVGYIDLRVIPDREGISETAAAAMTFVRHTDALIEALYALTEAPGRLLASFEANAGPALP